MKIPVKKYVMDETLSWEERYRQLEAHHLEEVGFLMSHVKKLEEAARKVSRGCDCEYDYRRVNCSNILRLRSLGRSGHRFLSGLTQVQILPKARFKRRCTTAQSVR